MSVQVSIFHYSPTLEEPTPVLGDPIIFNDILVKAVQSIRELTKIKYNLSIIDNESHPTARADLEKRLPNEEFISVPKHDQLTGPAGINAAILNNKCDYLVILSTDIVVTWDWLPTWFERVKQAEAYYGVPCAVSCEGLMPYPKHELSHGWGMEPEKLKEYSVKTMGLPVKDWNGIPISICNQSPGRHPHKNHDIGNELGFYMAHRSFWDEVGLHDEAYAATMEGIDMGLRVVTKTRCRNLIGGDLWIHHMGGLHSYVGCRKLTGPDGNWLGEALFTERWGAEIRKKVLYGTIWQEAHNAQKAKYGK